MQTRHQNALMSALERVVDIGCVEIRANELLIWYNLERHTHTIWRDISERWDDLLQNTKVVDEEDRASSLLVGEATGVWVLVWGQGLTTSAKSWLKDVRELGKVSPKQ